MADILLLAENGNLDGAKAPGLNDRKYAVRFTVDNFSDNRVVFLETYRGKQ